LKRKRKEVEDSESDDGEAASDEEFGWAAEDAALHAEELPE